MSIITTRRSCSCAAATVHSRSTAWITASSRTRLSTSGRFTVTAISRTRGRRLNSGTYVYLVANPYMKFEQFYVPSEPPVVALHGLYAEIANDAMGGILAETERQSPDQLQLCFCYMMDLLGIMTEKMPREYFHQTPGQK